MDEFDEAKVRLSTITTKFYADTGKKAKKVYISDRHELQSLMMWYANAWGLEFERTDKEVSYCE